MTWKWRKRVSTLIVSTVLFSLIPFGGIAALPLTEPLASPLYESFAPITSQTPNNLTNPSEILFSNKSSNNTDIFASAISSFNPHESSTVSSVTYNDKKSKIFNPTQAVKELINKRTRNSKTFLNNDGTTTVQTATYSLHYFDGQAWQDIDNTIRLDNTDPSFEMRVVSNNDISFTHSVLANNFKVKLDSRSSKESVTFSVYDQAVTYKAEGMNDVTGIVYGNTITYPNAWQSTDLQYQVQNDQLKMQMILQDNRAPKIFSFEMKTKGVKPRLNSDGSIDFVDKNGKVQFKIPQMWVQDTSSDAKRYDKLKVDVKQKGDKTLIEMTLEDKGLQYPLVIDPTTEMVIIDSSYYSMNRYVYDNSGRLRSFIFSKYGKRLEQNWTYDNNGNTINKNIDWYKESFESGSYDVTTFNSGYPDKAGS
ncbi:hypothetical protein, partial [Paenibacillus sp. SI8]|uniref:DUF7948 domain-containing protein n=1 Tax=unclassified Paenibacillus TaxID=185978 RepID=UPI0034666966